jgi:hypothetical protein
VRAQAPVQDEFAKRRPPRRPDITNSHQRRSGRRMRHEDPGGGRPDHAKRRHVDEFCACGHDGMKRFAALQASPALARFPAGLRGAIMAAAVRFRRLSEGCHPAESAVIREDEPTEESDRDDYGASEAMDAEGLQGKQPLSPHPPHRKSDFKLSVIFGAIRRGAW